MIVAKFIGEHNSMNFKKNHIYKLRSEIRNNWIWLYDIKNINTYCPYSSLENLLKNWEEIRFRE